MKLPSKSWDEKLREKLGDYESAVPDDLFKTVIKKREQRKWIAALRKRGRSLWLLLLLLIPFTCHYIRKGTAPVVENTIVKNETSAEKNQSLVPPAESAESVISFSSDQSTTLSTHDTNNSDNTNEKRSKKISAASDKSMSNFSAESISSSSFKNTSKTPKEAETSVADEEGVLFTASVNPVSQLKDNNQLNSEVQLFNTETIEITSLPLNTQNLFYENHLSQQMISITKENTIKTVNEVNDSAAAIEISPTSWGLHWSAEALFSPDISLQQLTDRKNDSLTLTDWNRRMEKSFTTGLRLSLDFDGGFFLKSGLTYSKEQASFTLEKTWAVPVILDSTYYYTIWHPFEDPQYVFYSDTTITSRDSVASYASSITYSFLNIPLLVGYTFDFNKFHLGVQSGVVFNAQFSKQGSSIDPQTLEPVSLPENNISFFRNRASLSIYAGLENEYRFNEHLGIFAEPYFQMQLKPVTTDAAPVEQRLYKVGLNTGIKFSF